MADFHFNLIMYTFLQGIFIVLYSLCNITNFHYFTTLISCVARPQITFSNDVCSKCHDVIGKNIAVIALAPALSLSFILCLSFTVLDTHTHTHKSIKRHTETRKRDRQIKRGTRTWTWHPIEKSEICDRRSTENLFLPVSFYYYYYWLAIFRHELFVVR